MRAIDNNTLRKHSGLEMKQHYKLLIGLVLGALLGILLHPFSDNKTLLDINTHILNPIGQIFKNQFWFDFVRLLIRKNV